jgi:hypothetical protein
MAPDPRRRFSSRPLLIYSSKPNTRRMLLSKFTAAYKPGTCSLNIPPQLIKAEFHLSVCCSTCFQEMKVKGCSHVAVQHLCKNYNEFVENTKKIHLKTWKGFGQRTYLLVMKIASVHAQPQLLHLTIVAVVHFNTHILLFVWFFCSPVNCWTFVT